MFKKKSTSSANTVTSIFKIHPASGHFSSPLPLSHHAQGHDHLLSALQPLPSFWSSFLLVPLQCVLCSQSTALKPSQIMTFLQNLPVASTTRIKARALPMLGGPTWSSPELPLISSPATLALSLSLPYLHGPCHCPSETPRTLTTQGFVLFFCLRILTPDSHIVCFSLFTSHFIKDTFLGHPI